MRHAVGMTMTMEIMKPEELRFAELVALGKPPIDAYMEVKGCSRMTARQGALRWMSRNVVAAKIADLQKAGAAKTALSIERKLAMLEDLLTKPVDQLPLHLRNIERRVVKAAGEDPALPGLESFVAQQVIETEKPLDFLKVMDMHNRLARHYSEDEKNEAEAGSNDALTSLMQRVAAGKGAE
jgi:hypothetical protein